MSVDKSLSRLPSAPTTPALPRFTPGKTFYSGIFVDRLGGNEWALFAHRDYLCSTIDAEFDRFVAKQDIKKLEANPGIPVRDHGRRGRRRRR